MALYFIPCGVQFLITRFLNKKQARVGFSKSGHGLGSGHLVLQRRDRLIWNRILFGISRALFWKKSHWSIFEAMAPHLDLLRL
ncbi:MAG TPA: hypothetical protein DDZ82_02735 [Rhodobacteraceae bacterium]|nr:hypothetical protein [Paracoccaceae bacterium]